jgi:hypothetical protein
MGEAVDRSGWKVARREVDGEWVALELEPGP